MSKMAGLIMLLCLVPTIIAMYFVLYPKKWEKRKTIFGIKNRAEFQLKENIDAVDAIVQRIRKLALWIAIPSIVLSVAFLFIPNMTAMMITYTVFVLLSIVIMNIPYARGYNELRSLKKEIGIISKGGTRSVDLKSINASHALNLPMLIIPNVLMGILMIISLLYDFKVINIGKNEYQGSFAASILAGDFLFLGILCIFIAKMMDNMRNDIVSEDSDINANYNRAKKKIWSDTWVALTWATFIALICMMVIAVLGWFEIGIIVSSIVYMLVLMVVMFILARKTTALNARYKTDNDVLEDDDDYWIYGMFYYNPKDSRLNIEKRAGVGSTINMAHPVGKIITGVTALLILVTILALVYVGLLETRPLDVRVEDGKVICHQFRDEYVIPVNDIQEVTYVDTMDDFHAVKVGGAATDTFAKGTFSVGDEARVKLYMSTEADCYIKIKTADKIYYINDVTREDTEDLFELLKK